jgi:hypothetical protein
MQHVLFAVGIMFQEFQGCLDTSPVTQVIGPVAFYAENVLVPGFCNFHVVD